MAITTLRRWSAGLTVACVLATLGATAAEPVQLETVIPQDSLALVKVYADKDAKSERSQTELAAFSREFKPFISALWAGLREQMPPVHEGQPDPVAMFHDLVAVTGTGMQLAFMGVDAERGAPRVLLAFNVGDANPAFDRLLDFVKQQAGPNGGPPPMEHNGVQIEFVGAGGPPLALARVGGLAVFGLLPDDVKLVIDGAAGAGGGSSAAALAQSPRYIQAMGRVTKGRPALASVYLDLGGIQRFVVQAAGKDNPQLPEMLHALGMAQVTSFAGALTSDGKQFATSVFVGAPSDGKREGLLGLMEFGAADASLAKLAPASASSFGAVNTDLGALFDRAIAFAGTLEPKAPEEVKRELAKVEERLGFSVRGDLLGSFGDQWMFATSPPVAGGFDTAVFSVSMRDSAKFMDCLNKLANMGGFAVKTREIAGRTYTYMLSPVGRLGTDPARAMKRHPEAMVMGSFLGFAFTIDGDRLYAGSSVHVVADYFDAMAKGSLADSAGYQALAAKFTPGAQMVTYSDPRASFGGVYNFGLMVATALEDLGRLVGVPVDTNLLPRAQDLVKHLSPGIGSFTIDRTGFALDGQASLGQLDSGVVAAAVVGVVAAIAIPNLMEARANANEASAIAIMRTFASAQEVHKVNTGEYATSIMDLVTAGVLAEGVSRKSGYKFQLRDTEGGWEATAHPIQPGKTGKRYFYVDQTNVIRAEYYMPAGAQSMPLGGL